MDVEIVDVARENVLHKIMQEERENIKTFPTLVADSALPCPDIGVKWL